MILTSIVRLLPAGPKVISKVITESSIDELMLVIKRPPVIWDNLHANDYDQRRLFLGPYAGRSVELISKLNGVLTNPNCEYGANYIPIHTLAQWSRCSRLAGRRSSPIKQSIMLEVEGSVDSGGVGGSGVGSGGKGCGSPGRTGEEADEVVDFCLYEPQKALELSLKEWYAEFHIQRKKTEHYQPVKSSESISKANDFEELGSCKMDTSRPPPVAKNSMHALDTLPSPVDSDVSSSDPFSLDDMELLIDYFYLPHKHGQRAMMILEEFCWLKEHTPGYELLKSHGYLKGDDEGEEDIDDDSGGGGGGAEFEGAKGQGGGEGMVSDGMRSDGETSESIAEDEEMSSSDVSTGGDYIQAVGAFYIMPTILALRCALIGTFPP